VISPGRVESVRWKSPTARHRSLALNAAQWRQVREQRRDLDDELRRLAMREHEPRR
jgi:hypothetical protein